MYTQQKMVQAPGNSGQAQLNQIGAYGSQRITFRYNSNGEEITVTGTVRAIGTARRPNGDFSGITIQRAEGGNIYATLRDGALFITGRPATIIGTVTLDNATKSGDKLALKALGPLPHNGTQILAPELQPQGHVIIHYGLAGAPKSAPKAEPGVEPPHRLQQLTIYRIPGAPKGDGINQVTLLDVPDPKDPKIAKDPKSPKLAPVTIMVGKEPQRVVRFVIEDSISGQLRVRNPTKGPDGKLYSGFLVLDANGIVTATHQGPWEEKGEKAAQFPNLAYTPLSKLNPGRAVNEKPTLPEKGKGDPKLDPKLSQQLKLPNITRLAPMLGLGSGPFAMPPGGLASNALFMQGPVQLPQQQVAPPFSLISFGGNANDVFPVLNVPGQIIQNVEVPNYNNPNTRHTNQRLASQQEMLALLTPPERVIFNSHADSAQPGVRTPAQTDFLNGLIVRSHVLAYNVTSSTPTGLTTEPLLIRYGNTGQMLGISFRGQIYDAAQARTLAERNRDNSLPKGLIAAKDMGDPIAIAKTHWIADAKLLAPVLFSAIDQHGPGYTALMVLPKLPGDKVEPPYDQPWMQGIDPRTTMLFGPNTKEDKYLFMSTDLAKAPWSLHDQFNSLKLDKLANPAAPRYPAGPKDPKNPKDPKEVAAHKKQVEAHKIQLAAYDKEVKAYEIVWNKALEANLKVLPPQRVTQGPNGPEQRVAYLFATFHAYRPPRQAGVLALEANSLPTWLAQAYGSCFDDKGSGVSFNRATPLIGKALADFKAQAGPPFNGKDIDGIQYFVKADGTVKFQALTAKGLADPKVFKEFDPRGALITMARWNGRMLKEGKFVDRPNTPKAIEPASLPPPITLKQAFEAPDNEPLRPKLLTDP